MNIIRNYRYTTHPEMCIALLGLIYTVHLNTEISAEMLSKERHPVDSKA